MKKLLPLFVAVLLVSCSAPQQTTPQVVSTASLPHANPKLVVGIVVDQMRYDYITRFWDRYQSNGFKRLVGEGFNMKNAHFNYIPTYTGPGHASVWTGGSPKMHGIIGNNWFDKFSGSSVYCAGDSDVNPVGTTSSAGQMSPHRMLTTSVADQNRLHTQMQGKTIGIALKDRGAILPAGHTANAAYWFHGQDEGVWITSDFYIDQLPQWVQDFNRSGRVDSYMKPWETLYDLSTYTRSGPDDTSYEGGFKGKDKTTFPYNLPQLQASNGGYEILKSTPYGNSLTTDFALAAIEGEHLGQDGITDFLTLSYSSTDYVGHNFGVNSVEVEDTYLRLDLELARLLAFLDQKVGQGNYTVFLTADHGAVHVPSYLESVNIPSGYFNYNNFRGALEAFILETTGAQGLITNISNNQIFFDYQELSKQQVDPKQLQELVKQFALGFDKINMAFTRSQLESTDYTTGLEALLDEGFHQKRSGDVMLVLEPSVISYSRTGSTHGSGFNYDTHAPMIFYGHGIKKGSSMERADITDIAPTISALLGVSYPNGATGRPLEVVLED